MFTVESKRGAAIILVKNVGYQSYCNGSYGMIPRLWRNNERGVKLGDEQLMNFDCGYLIYTFWPTTDVFRTVYQWTHEPLQSSFQLLLLEYYQSN